MSTKTIYQSSTLEKRVAAWKYKAERIHNFKYNYDESIQEFKNQLTHIPIECNIHGKFLQTPANHLCGKGCKKCAVIKSAKLLSSNTKVFAEKANIVHNFRYGYNEVIYINNYTHVNIECSDHGIFPQSPDAHLKGNGCPYCSNKGYSKVSIEWLNSISSDIQHAENGGEFRITKSDNTYYKIDGYDKSTNTVYEFHGDVYHGNPDKFDSEDHCHPFNKEVTAGELYRKTMERENEITSLGYNLVVMWESDFKLIID